MTEIVPEAAADCEITSSSVCLASSKEDIESIGTQQFHGTSGSVSSALAWPDSDIIAVFVRLTVSYNPSGLQSSPQVTLGGQRDLWQSLQGTW